MESTQMEVSELNSTARLIARSFLQNPSYSIIFDPHQLEEGLQWLMERSLALYQGCARTEIIRDSKTLEPLATATWVPPGMGAPGLGKMFKTGLLQMPLLFGWKAMSRMVRLKKLNEQDVASAAGTDQYWYLSMVAVESSQRGNGMGTWLLADHLEKWIDHRKPALPVVLSTQAESNLRFYSRLGFKVRSESLWDVDGRTARSWSLSREPR